MGKIKFFDKEVTAGFIGEGLEIAAKATDVFDLFENDGLLSVIPFGQLAKFLGKKLFTIKDKDKAFQKAFSLAYFTTFANALKRYNADPECEKEDLDELKKKTGAAFRTDDFDINNFYDNEIVTKYRQVYENFLKGFGTGEPNITKIFKYVRDYLELNFYLILEKFPLTYKNYTYRLKTKSYEISRELNRKNRYYSDLKNEFTAPMFNDETGMSLADTYVEPGFRVHEYCTANSGKSNIWDWYKRYDRKGFVEHRSYKDSIHRFIYSLIKNNNPIEDLRCPGANVIFILGYPGQGKTSFCKKTMYDILSEQAAVDTRFYFVRFKDIKNVADFINFPLEVIKEKIEEDLDTKLSKNEFDRSLLILDGLDELYMRDNMSVDQIDEICKELSWVAEQKIIITSRYGYIAVEKLKKREALILQLMEFDPDMQNRWLGNYKRFHPETALTEKLLRDYNSGSGFEHIKELIDQPILLYMFTTSGFAPDETGTNRAKIYDNLFTSLIERKYEKSGQVELLKNIEKEDLREFIRDIALSIFHTGKDYINKSTLLKHDSTRRFIEKFEQKSVHHSLKGIMMAFYFSEVRKQKEDDFLDDRNDYAVEFLHKSLYEYMAAEKIWHEMNAFRDHNDRTREYNINRIEDALGHIFTLFSKQLLSLEIVDYLTEIINNDNETDKEKLSERMSHFLPPMLEKDFLHEYKQKDCNYPFNSSLNTFYGFWVVLSNIVGDKKIITDSERSRFVFMLRSLLYLNRGRIRLNLSNQDLSGADLRGVGLSGVDLRGTGLSGAVLSGTDLRKADLRGADFSRAALRQADLCQADLRGADLRQADLSGAKLLGANLIEANLIEANLSDANLSTTNLSETDLRGAKLGGADLSRADLRGVDLRGAVLGKAKLPGADLMKTILSKANYELAKKAGANVHGAIVDR